MGREGDKTLSKEKKPKKITLATLTLPIFAEIMLSMLMGNADSFMLSQHSDDSVAAVGIANQIIFLLVVMFGFIATGTTVLISRAVGAKDNKSANEIAAVSLVANLIIGSFLSILIFLYQDQVLKLMNVKGDINLEAQNYLLIVGGFMFTQAIMMTISAILRSHGHTKDTMYINVAINFMNIIGNYLVLFGPFGLPVLGVEGVALSTTVSRCIGLAIFCLVLKKRIPEPIGVFTVYKIPRTHLQELLRIGLSAAGEHLSYNLSQFVIVFFITTYMGTVFVTTRIYAFNLMVFMSLASMALSQGTQILVGQYIGARRYEDAYKRVLDSLKISVGLAFVVAIVFSIFAEPLLSIFTDNELIINEAKKLIYLAIILEPGRAFNIVLISSLRAVGDVKFPFVMGIVSMWGVCVTVAYLFGVHWQYGLVGIWFGFILDEWLRGVTMFFRWRSRGWMDYLKSRA